jgi:regulator of protease activity HflC (stomatin/prohibitin superfamily)
MVQERRIRPMSGWPALVICLVLLTVAPLMLLAGLGLKSGTLFLLGIAGMVSLFMALFGFQAVQPNDARVLLLFGEYRGTIAQTGFYWVNPFDSKRRVSLRVRNFETGSSVTPETRNSSGQVLTHRSRTAGKPSKVKDRDGNPIDISAVVVWRVSNTAEALFEVDDYEDFVSVQSEAALRSLASRPPYDSEDHEVSLRGNTVQVCEELKQDVQERLDKAGVEVLDARISHLAYSAEIAAAMLQRQQAQAVVAARMKIVEGAVGMVQMALEHLDKDQVVELDNERKAAMVANLLVVLCSDRHTQPIVNTGV